MLEDDLRRQHPPGTSDLVPPVETYLHTYGIIHEHWHIEDWIQTRQTMAYSPPAPRPAGPGPTVAIANAWGGTFKLEPFVTDYDPTNEGGGPCPGEVEVPGGRYMLGGSKKQPWLFDAERFEHPVVIKPFAIDKAPVTNAAYAEFIEAGGLVPFQLRRFFAALFRVYYPVPCACQFSWARISSKLSSSVKIKVPLSSLTDLLP